MYVKENVYNCQNLIELKNFKIILNYNYFNNQNFTAFNKFILLP